MPGRSTPVRAHGTPTPDGYVLLRDVESTYRDGGEEAVLELIRAASDLSSMSDELIGGAKDWAQTYHLHPARANIVRCLDLPADARVLEIGAGCGAVTRYLGETCALVDALEPVPVRAVTARARTGDQENVEVFVGELCDVPAEAAYDVVVVIGVLEYVGGGSAEPAPYLEFLRGIEERLVPGGTLVLAIENALGAKYFAGAPEDHSNRLFDSLEGYPADSPARTFSRAQLAGLFRDAGLQPTFRAAFPDYKITRTVLGEFPENARSLLHRIPQFPSPDWVGPLPRLLDEGALWRTLVESGLDQDTGNSFLVLGTKSGGKERARLWPAERCGVYYSINRRAPYTMQTVVRRDGETVTFLRTRVCAGSGAEALTVVGGEYPYEAGEDLIGYVVKHHDADVAGLLDNWLALLTAEEAKGEGLLPLDLVPHNLVVAPSGELKIIDIELFAPVTREKIVRRGVLWMGHHVAQASPHGRWPGVETVQDLVVKFGELVGLPADGSWIDAALTEESRIQHDVIGADEKQVRALFGQRLDAMPLARRLGVAALTAAEQLERSHREVLRRLEDAERAFDEYRSAAERSLAEAEERRAAAERGLAQLEATKAVRLARRARRGLGRARHLLARGATRAAVVGGRRTGS